MLKRKSMWILAGILVLAGVLRFWALDTGLPNMSRPDEQNISRPVVDNIMRSFFMGQPTLNPGFFIYPSLYMYLLLMGYSLFYLVGHLTGIFPNGAAFLMLYQNDWYSFHVISRGISALMGTLTVWAMYRLALAFFKSRLHALLCAFLIAITYLHVRDSHFGVTDIPATLWVTCALWLAVLFYRTQAQKHLYGALAFAGLAASTKYPAGMVALVPLTLWWQSKQAAGITLSDCFRRPSQLMEVLKLVGVLFGAFLITSPYILFDFHRFLADFLQQTNTMKETHYLNLGPAWIHHLRFSLWYGLGSLYFLAALAGIVLALRGSQNRKLHLALLIYTGVYYVLMGRTYVSFARYIIPLIPVLCLYAVACADFLARRVKQQNSIKLSHAALCTLVTLLLGAQSLCLTLQFSRVIHEADTRNEARNWLLARLRPNEAVGTGVDITYTVQLPNQFRKFSLVPLENPPQPGAMKRNFVPPQDTRFGEKGSNRELNEFGINTYGDTTALKKLGIRYVAIAISPLTLYNPPDFELARLEDPALFKLAAKFSPTREGAKPPASDAYDQLDGFYLPLTDYTGIVRPGPEVRIYEVL